MEQKKIYYKDRKDIYLKEAYFPDAFIKKYKALLGSEWGEFFAAIQKEKENTFWVNTNKTTVKEIKDTMKEKGISITQLPFHEQAFSIDHPKPSNLSEYLEGKISLQEKASMLPAIAIEAKEGENVFDTCAAPGMKTIQLSNMVGESGKVLATELNDNRHILLDNILKKFDCKNVTTKRIDFRNIKRNKKFDKIILDAPCSSERLIRKQREALLEWSPTLVRKKAANQKNLLQKGFDYLKEGGEMIYSTCSFSPEEDEEVVLDLLSKRKNASIVPIKLEGLKIRKNDLCENCVRLFPQDNDTQQFFLAKIKKETK
jgi:NOL1/NOP2/sun family putative RNA methylase